MEKISQKNKRAVFFTTLSIVILSLFLISYTLYSVSKSREAVGKRIETLNSFVFSVEQDLPRKLYIAGFGIIFLFENKIAETGSYVTNLDSKFEEAFFNGTIDGEDYKTGENQTLYGATFSDMQESLNEKANSVNAYANITNPNLTISQEDPWRVKVVLTTELFIKDTGELASWNKTFDIVAYIPVENFEDPLYILNTRGKVSNKVNRTIYENFVSGSDVTNLTSHLENSYYINNSDAPSFLNRLQGSLSPSVNGVESLVYLPELSAQGIATKDKSAVDHIYFSSETPSSHHIAGMPAWFMVDDAHLSVYQVSELKID